MPASLQTKSFSIHRWQMLRILEMLMPCFPWCGPLAQRLGMHISTLISDLVVRTNPFFLLRPIIGGGLSDLATRWPDTLGRIEYIRQHPYFLPCATAGIIAFATFIISFFGLKEVFISKKESAPGFTGAIILSDFTFACCSTKKTTACLGWYDYTQCHG